MGYETEIGWTGTQLSKPVMWKGKMTEYIPGATFNVVIGCTKVSPACKFCYAERLDNRWGGKNWGPNAPRQIMSDDYWKKPLMWDKEAKAAGIQRKVFCSSMADWAEDHPALVNERAKLFALIEATPNLIWLLLTKRPENIMRFIPDEWKRVPPKNVWYGTTVESPDYMWRVDELCKVPAYLRFVSLEPLLAPVDMSPYLRSLFLGVPIFSDRIGARGGIHWVITGGESGAKNDIRLSSPHWFFSLRDQCKNAVVPFYFKQWGEYMSNSFSIITSEPIFREFRDKQHWINKGNTWVRKGRCIGIDGTECKIGADFDKCGYPVTVMDYVGKKKAGNILDGDRYEELPDYYYGTVLETSIKK